MNKLNAMELIPFLAAISTDGLVNALVWLVVTGIIVWLLYWALQKISPPEPFMKVGTVIIVLVTVVVLINILLTLVGKPLFR